MKNASWMKATGATAALAAVALVMPSMASAKTAEEPIDMGQYVIEYAAEGDADSNPATSEATCANGAKALGGGESTRHLTDGDESFKVGTSTWRIELADGVSRAWVACEKRPSEPAPDQQVD